jgi:hypothetical protein
MNWLLGYFVLGVVFVTILNMVFYSIRTQLKIYNLKSMLFVTLVLLISWPYSLGYLIYEMIKLRRQKKNSWINLLDPNWRPKPRVKIEMNNWQIMGTGGTIIALLWFIPVSFIQIDYPIGIYVNTFILYVWALFLIIGSTKQAFNSIKG